MRDPSRHTIFVSEGKQKCHGVAFLKSEAGLTSLISIALYLQSRINLWGLTKNKNTSGIFNPISCLSIYSLVSQKI